MATDLLRTLGLQPIGPHVFGASGRTQVVKVSSQLRFRLINDRSENPIAENVKTEKISNVVCVVHHLLQRLYLHGRHR